VEIGKLHRRRPAHAAVNAALLPMAQKNSPELETAMHQNRPVSTAGMLPDSACAPDLPRLRALVTRDPDDLARNLTGWHQVYDQISCGAFEGGLDELSLPDVQVFRERINQSVHQACCVRPDAIWFGLPLEPAASRINGRQVEAASVMARPGNRHFELITPRNHEIYGIVVSRAVLEEQAERGACTVALDKLEKAEILRVDPAARSACLHTLSTVLGGEDAPGKTRGEAARLRAQASVLAALLHMLDSACAEATVLKSLQRRQHVVARARAYLLEHKDQAVSIPELCEHTHVSRRTLQYCFEDVLGISPVVYLRCLRLNGIRRALLDEAAPERGIGGVASDWGIDNFSQFSSDFRKLFGKTPSAYVKASCRLAGE
jgi:AraC family ethanolamine operon transcriptional activator